jgi:hypothetical protein
MQWACLKASLITLHAALLKMRLAMSSLTLSAKRQCSCIQKRIKFTSQSIKQLKFEIYLLNLLRTSSLRHPERSPGRRTASASSGSTGTMPGIATSKRSPAPC